MGFSDWVFVRLGRPRPPGRVGAALREAVGLPSSPGDRRRVPRFDGLGARVIVDGHEYDVVDWTEASFRMTGYTGDLVVRQIVHFRFLLVYREETWEWPGLGRVVRIEENGDVAVIYRVPQEPFRGRLRNVVAAIRASQRLTDGNADSGTTPEDEHDR